MSDQDKNRAQAERFGMVRIERTGKLCRACSIETRGDDRGDLRGLVFEGADDVGFEAMVTCAACGPTMVNSEGLCMFGTCMKAGRLGHGGIALKEQVIARNPFDEEDEDDDDDDVEEEEDDEDDVEEEEDEDDDEGP